MKLGLHTHHCMECLRPYVCKSDDGMDCWMYCVFHRPKAWKITDFFRGFLTGGLKLMDKMEGKVK